MPNPNVPNAKAVKALDDLRKEGTVPMEVEDVYRELKKLEEQGLLRINSKEIEITDHSALECLLRE